MELVVDRGVSGGCHFSLGRLLDLAARCGIRVLSSQVLNTVFKNGYFFLNVEYARIDN